MFADNNGFSILSHRKQTHIKPYARAKPLGHIPVPGITFKSIVFYLAAEVIFLLLENHNKGMVRTDRQAGNGKRELYFCLGKSISLGMEGEEREWEREREMERGCRGVLVNQLT